jgi:hypothetical protein
MRPDRSKLPFKVVLIFKIINHDNKNTIYEKSLAQDVQDYNKRI